MVRRSICSWAFDDLGVDRRQIGFQRPGLPDEIGLAAQKLRVFGTIGEALVQQACLDAEFLLNDFGLLPNGLFLGLQSHHGLPMHGQSLGEDRLFRSEAGESGVEFLLLFSDQGFEIGLERCRRRFGDRREPVQPVAFRLQPRRSRPERDRLSRQPVELGLRGCRIQHDQILGLLHAIAVMDQQRLDDATVGMLDQDVAAGRRDRALRHHRSGQGRADSPIAEATYQQRRCRVSGECHAPYVGTRAALPGEALRHHHLRPKTDVMRADRRGE
ncbi:hypothetical protein [Mesorhizobium sp. USDA 4775]